MEEFSSSVATRLPYSLTLTGIIFNREGLELRLGVRYFGLLLPLLLSIFIIILSSFFEENFPVNVKSSVDAVFDLGVGVQRAFFVDASAADTDIGAFIDVDGNDVPILFTNALLFVNTCWSFIESLVLANKLIELLDRLSGSSSIDGPATGVRSAGGGDDDCFCFLLFLSFLCFLCFFLTTSLFTCSLLGWITFGTFLLYKCGTILEMNVKFKNKIWK